jgi:transcriptional regulator with XRE-family HTH domain
MAADDDGDQVGATEPGHGPDADRRNGHRSELAARRLASGFSQETFAHHLGVSVSSVRGWELGTRTPRPQSRRAIAGALDVTPVELDRLLSPGSAIVVGSEALAKVMRGLSLFVRAEAMARTAWSCEPTAIPALLQVEGYSRMVEKASHRSPGALEIEEMARMRLARQEALRRQPEPLVLHTIVPIHVLMGEHVESEQLAHLVAMAGWPNVHLQAIEPRHLAPVPASFTLLASPGADEPDLGVEFSSRAPSYEEFGPVVADMMQLWRHLSAVAMSEKVTRELLATRHLKSNQRA